MANERVYIRVSGRVQGVGYRMFTRQAARSFGLSGWVRNCRDGSVELEAQGVSEQLAQFELSLREGPPLGRVTRLERRTKDVRDDEPGFEIRH